MTVDPRSRRLAGLPWPSLALSLGQLALMATSLIFSLSLAYAGGLSAVGVVAPAVLVFQLTCGVIQRTLVEATLLASSHADLRADHSTCQWSVAVALAGGTAGAALAVLSSLAVPDAPTQLAIVYAAGIPFAIALDIGRSGGVASGAPRSAFGETAAWLTVQIVLMLIFAAARSPLGICTAWLLTNVVFLLLTTAQPHRRPAVRGLAAWLRSRRALMGAASFDALLAGLTPVLALQATAFVATAATLGSIRLVQQVFAPMAFVSITLQRVLIYRRRADRASTPLQDARVGVLVMGSMAMGTTVLAAAVLTGREIFPALAFIPVGAVLVAAAAEKAAMGLSFGSALNKFVRGEFRALLRARWLMLVAATLLCPLWTAWWGAPGYLYGSCVAMAGYAVVVITTPTTRRVKATAPAQTMA